MDKTMDKTKSYITDEETINCRKVADAFSELLDSEDIAVLNAGKYGFVKLQYFKYPDGFDNMNSYYDSKSLFNALWDEWLYTQLICLSAGTPMENMNFDEILQCLPEEKRKELLDKQFYFADKTGVINLLVEL